MKRSKRNFLIVIGLALASAAIVARLHHTAAIHADNKHAIAPRQIGASQQGSGQASVDHLPSMVPAKINATSTDQWAEEFYNSKDYYAFVSKAAKPALDGDGRAAFYIYKAISVCSPIVRQYGKSSSPDTAFEAFWASRPNPPDWLISRARREFDVCAGFLANDPFATLPPRPEGYSRASFWVDQAYADGDPLAQSVHAGAALSALYTSPSAGARTNATAAAQSDINSAALSGDPAALFKIGQILSDGHHSDNPIQGFALSLAACNLGYDCSASNSDLEGFLGCAQQGTCPPGITYSDVIKKAVGNSGYEEAYELAQTIQNAVVSHDATAVSQFVRLSAKQ